MCGRYTGVDGTEVFPTDLAPVLADSGGKITVTAMKWGYPGFPDSKHPNAKPRPLINAKAETVLSLPTWKDSVTLRRCIIPSGGFYEWQHGGVNDKQKYLFRLPNESELFMAAIYKPFTLENEEAFPHFSVLTTAANASIADVHSRMPVIVRRDETDEWLYGDFAKLFDRGAIALERFAV